MGPVSALQLDTGDGAKLMKKILISKKALDKSMEAQTMKSKKAGLKPCPWCGPGGLLKVWEIIGRYWVYCEKCITYGPVAKSNRGAIKKWNTRKAR